MDSVKNGSTGLSDALSGSHDKNRASTAASSSASVLRTPIELDKQSAKHRSRKQVMCGKRCARVFKNILMSEPTDLCQAFDQLLARAVTGECEDTFLQHVEQSVGRLLSQHACSSAQHTAADDTSVSDTATTDSDATAKDLAAEKANVTIQVIIGVFCAPPLRRGDG